METQKQKLIAEIDLIRSWLNSIEKDLAENTVIQAGVVLYLNESTAKVSYRAGMYNQELLTKAEQPKERE